MIAIRLLGFVSIMVSILACGLMYENPNLNGLPTTTPNFSDAADALDLRAQALDLRVFPPSLVCDKQVLVEPIAGPTWINITIGQSTFDDLETQLFSLSPDYRLIEDGLDNRFILDLPLRERREIDEFIPTAIYFCTENNIITSLFVRHTIRPYLLEFKLSDLVLEMGLPDAITWTDDYVGRIVFWLEYGIAAEIIMVTEEGFLEGYPDHVSSADAPAIGMAYFPYHSGDYINAWPYNQIRKLNPYLPDPAEIYDFGPENPFYFEQEEADIDTTDSVSVQQP